MKKVMKDFIVTTENTEDTRIVCDTGCLILAMYPSSLLVRCDENQYESLKKSRVILKELAK
ncbi:MAG: hypothetical protein OER04_05320 [Cyclobacteriaceae bacterium]|nr:hypothetical protein [Cyclobacteriaceae bacterium]